MSLFQNEQLREQLFSALQVHHITGAKTVWFGIDPETGKKEIFETLNDFEIYATRLQIIGFEFLRTEAIAFHLLSELEATEGTLMLFKLRPDHLLSENIDLPTAMAAIFEHELTDGEFLMGKVTF